MISLELLLQILEENFIGSSRLTTEHHEFRCYKKFFSRRCERAISR